MSKVSSRVRVPGGLGRVAVEDGLHAPVEAERDEGGFDVGGEGDGGAAEGDAVVRVGLWVGGRGWGGGGRWRVWGRRVLQRRGRCCSRRERA